jgi:3-deoxy-D-manno-octulosonic-acid transferase
MSAPALDALLQRRLKAGKEDAARIGERRGASTLARPPGFLVWIHAISVGEANSVLPLIDALLARNTQLSVLLTTGTLTSAGLMKKRLPAERALHQFAPLDHPAWVQRFLDHWRPDLGLITESELWPNLLLGAEARGIPLVLLNARISARTTARWLRFPEGIARLLRVFTLCLAQDWDTAARLYALGALHVETPGNLKFAAAPLPDQPDLRTALETQLRPRPRFLAASTHPGEEDLIAEAHRLMQRNIPDLLTLIVPRHPARGPAVATSLVLKGFKVARRIENTQVTGATEIYVADTMGELGLFYRLAPVVFLGRTLTTTGGQNPLEPARIGCAILHGPHTENFSEIFAKLDQAGASETVKSPQELALAAGRLITDPALRDERIAAGITLAAAESDVLPRILKQLAPLLPPDESLARARA